MRLIQVTDLHIGSAGDCPYDVDVRKNFLNFLAAIQQETFDHLVISGDLCYDVGDPAIYAWIREQLAQLTVPYAIIPGNHDDSQMIIDAFELQHISQKQQLFYTGATGHPSTIYLDSGVGEVSDLQLDYLREQLDIHDGPALLFIHHPPAEMGVPFMDQKHALRNGAQVMDILLAHPHPVSVFCGHYHVDKSVRIRNVDIHVTPSCFFQIDWREPEFKVDHYRCAYRWIDWDGSRLEHAVVYLDDATTTPKS